MSFTPVELETYARREHYERFLQLQLTYSATVPIDITELRAIAKHRDVRIYAAQTWLLTAAANCIPEFRMNRDASGALGIWDRLDPLYTVLDQSTHIFTSLRTPFDADFGVYYQHYLSDIETWETGAHSPPSNEPANALNISSIPWVGFTAFNLNLMTDYLLPILTIGKHAETDGRTLMPLSIQVHHAVCDGFHLGQFAEQVQQLADAAPDWIS